MYAPRAILIQPSPATRTGTRSGEEIINGSDRGGVVGISEKSDHNIQSVVNTLTILSQFCFFLFNRIFYTFLNPKLLAAFFRRLFLKKFFVRTRE